MADRPLSSLGAAVPALALLLLAPTAPAAARVRLPSSFVGMNSADLNPNGAATRHERRQLSTMQRNGIGTVRTAFDVRAPVGAEDRFVLAAAHRHVRVLPVLLDFARWRATEGPRHGLAPPRRLGRFARRAARLVGRYGHDGTFWRSHPSLRRYAIREWQVWNEPNLPVYWRPRPSPRAYARMLREAGRAIHARDPRAIVVTAGLPNSRQSWPRTYSQYLRDLLLRGGWRQGDALGVNVYAPTVGAVRDVLRTYRRIANAHRGRHLGLLITETGWADAGYPNPMVVGSPGQALRIGAFYRFLAGVRHRLHISGAFYFQWRDHRVHRGDPRGNTWGYHTGLYTAGRRPKPALRAFQTAVLGR